MKNIILLLITLWASSSFALNDAQISTCLTDMNVEMAMTKYEVALDDVSDSLNSELTNSLSDRLFTNTKHASSCLDIAISFEAAAQKLNQIKASISKLDEA